MGGSDYNEAESSTPAQDPGRSGGDERTLSSRQTAQSSPTDTDARRPPSRTAKLFLVDYASLLCMLGIILSGIVLWLFTEKGPGGDKYFWGWHRHSWSTLHLDFSLLFLILLAIHFVQHWRWIRSVAPKQVRAPGRPRGWAAILITTVLTLGIISVVFFGLGDWTASVRSDSGQTTERQGGGGRGRNQANTGYESGAEFGPAVGALDVDSSPTTSTQIRRRRGRGSATGSPTSE